MLAKRARPRHCPQPLLKPRRTLRGLTDAHLKLLLQHLVRAALCRPVLGAARVGVGPQVVQHRARHARQQALLRAGAGVAARARSPMFQLLFLPVTCLPWNAC